MKDSKVSKTYPGTSGAEGYQNSDNTGEPDGGPVPDGDYSVDLRPKMDRVADYDHKTGDTKPDVGVDLLPWFNGWAYSGWGQWRARLEKVNVNSTRDNFYFHDSYKGYSHGCIETSTSLYYDLSHFRKGGQHFVKVKVSYKPHSSTLGNTRQQPPPWYDPKIKPMPVGNELFYSPVRKAFPDPTKM